MYFVYQKNTEKVKELMKLSVFCDEFGEIIKLLIFSMKK